MRDAFAATQLALAREQRVSAVGGLAAAAAHQLGSPLATIAVIAKELVRDLPSDQPSCRGRRAAAEPKRALPHHSCRSGAAARRRRRAAAAPAVLGAGRGRGRALSRRRRAARRRRDPNRRRGARRQRRSGAGADGGAQPRDHAWPRQSHPERDPIRGARGRPSPSAGARTAPPSTSSMTGRAFRSRFSPASANPIFPVGPVRIAAPAYGAGHLYRPDLAGAHRRAADLRQSCRGRRPGRGGMAARRARRHRDAALVMWRSTHDGRTRQPREPCSSALAGLPEHERTLLIVDDDAPLCQRLARAMERRGFVVTDRRIVAAGIDAATRAAAGLRRGRSAPRRRQRPRRGQGAAQGAARRRGS